MASIVSAGTTSATSLNLSADTTGILQLASNNGTVALTVDTSQNVGMGTTTPGARLHVVTNVSSSYGGIIYNNNATGQGLTIRAGSTSSQDAFNCQTYNGGISLFTVQGGGNVGIGTSSPATLTHLLSASNTQLRVETSNTGAVTVSQYKNAAGDVHQVGSETSAANAGFTGSSAYDLCLYAGGTRGISMGNNSGAWLKLSSTGNVLVKATAAPSGVTADTFFLLTAGTATLGTANASGYIVYTKTIAQGVATTLITPADIDKWAGVIFISYVRDADQNRSGMMMVRYAYNRTYTTLLDSSQNSGATFSVSGNNLQVTLGGAGSYFCEIQIWGGAGP